MKFRRLTTRVATVCVCAAGALLLPAAAAEAAVLAGNTGWAWGNPSPQVNALLVADAAGGRIFAAGESGTLISSGDGGLSWKAISTGVLDPVQHVDALRDTSAVFATRCGLRRTDDDGQSVHILPWGPSQASCPSPIAGLSFPSLSTGYLMLADGSLLSSDDGGFAWHSLTPLPGTPAAGGSENPSAIAFSSRLNGVALVGTAILRTVDGGGSWLPVVTGAPAPVRAVDFIDAGNGFAVGDGGTAWRTDDGGASFTPLAAGVGVGQNDLTTLHCAAGTECVATDRARGAVVAVSAAGTRLLTRPPLELIGDATPGGAGIVAAGARGEIAASSDGGASWRLLSSRLDKAYQGLRGVSTAAAYAFGPGGAIAATADGGMSWSDASIATGARVFDVSLDAGRTGLVATSDGMVHVLDRGADARQFRVGNAPRALRVLGGRRALLVGPKGLRILETARGRTAFVRGVGRRARLNSLDMSRGSIVAFGRREAFIANRSGRRWRKLRLPRTRSVSSLDFVSASTGYLLDTYGELWFTESGGRAWRRIETTGDTAFTSVAFHDDMHGYLASASGRILRTEDGGSVWKRQFPFFDAGQDSPLVVEATGANTALALGVGTNRLFATVAGGQAGSNTRLGMTEGDPLYRRQGSVQVVGRVLPAKGGELVSVMARAKNAKPGAKWVARTVAADAEGRFSTLWKISQRTVFVARWSGDAGRESVGAVPLVVKPKSK